jgi:phospholipase C
VPPPAGDAWGPGARVPTIIVSSFARRGYIDSMSYETASILPFIEHRWGLPALATRDAAAKDLMRAFDFTQPPQ